MRSRSALCAVVLLIFSGASIADDTSKSAPVVDPTDSQFLQKAATASTAEVELGELALQKSADSKIKQFAQRIVDEQRKNGDQLGKFAAARQVKLPTAASADAAKALTEMKAKDSDAFDQAWSKTIAKNHADTVKLFADESGRSKDPELRKFAATTLPALKNDSKTATRLVAVPSARDKAMGDAMKSMTDTSVGSAPAVSTSAPVPAMTTVPATAAKPDAEVTPPATIPTTGPATPPPAPASPPPAHGH